MIEQIASQIRFSSTDGRPQTISLQNIVDLVDKYHGVIFGSVMHKFRSELSYTPSDLDMLFMSADEQLKFRASLAKLFETSGIKWKHYSACNDRYPFASGINARKQVSLTFKSPSGVWIKIHTVHFDSAWKNFPAQRKLKATTGEEYVATMMEHVAQHKDFLCNFYYKQQICYKLVDVVNVEVASFLVGNRDFKRHMDKYIFRGVKFSLMDQSAAIKPSMQSLSAAKDRYRSLGLVVIPLCRKDRETAGKTPMTPNWNIVNKYYDFDVTQQVANIGLVCGAASGIVCIDVDMKDRGVEMFDKMVLHYGPLPETCAVQRTPNGGYHYIFKYDPTRMTDMGAKIKCPKLNGSPIGVDMWIQNCQFVASPSVNYLNGKSYKWIREITSIDELPNLPEWVYTLYEHENIDESGRIDLPQCIDLPASVETLKIVETDTEVATEAEGEAINYVFPFDMGFKFDASELLQKLSKHKQQLLGHKYAIAAVIVFMVILSTMGMVMITIAIAAVIIFMTILSTMGMVMITIAIAIMCYQYLKANSSEH